MIQFSDLISSSDLSSDHLPVKFSILIENNKNIVEHKIPRYDLADWKQFSVYINNNLDLSANSKVRNIENCNSIDELIKHFCDTVLTAQRTTIPTSKVKNVSTLQPIRVTADINMLIRLRKIRRQQWQRNRDPRLKAIVNQLNKTISKEFQLLRNNRWEKHLEDIEDNSKKNFNRKLWKTAKILRTRKKGIPTLIIPANPQNSQSVRQIILTDVEKSNIIGKKFEDVHTAASNIEDNLFSRNIKDHTLNLTSRPAGFINEDIITPKEIKKIINNLKNNKAPGEDRINNRLIKNIPKKAVVFMTYLFNERLRRSYFPSCWKNAVVIAIPKPGKDISLPENYRPISLLCALSKIFERLIHTRLEIICDLLDIIPNDQFGFRKGHSTTHQLARVTSYIKSKFQNKESVGMVVLDIQKALIAFGIMV